MTVAGSPEPVVDVSPELHGYSPPAVVLPPSAGERAAAAWRALTASPGRAALATLAGGAAVIAALALQPVTVQTLDRVGPLRVECGVQYFAFGHDDEAVQQICRDAYAGRAVVLAIAGVAALAAAIALSALLRRPPAAVAANPLASTPPRAALAVTLGLLFVVLVASLSPVRVHGRDADGAFSAQCGIAFYVSGHDNEVVERACGRAYRGHAVALFVASMTAGAVLVALAATLHADLKRGAIRRRASPRSGSPTN